MALIRDVHGNYRTKRSTRATEHDVLAAAESILQTRLIRLGAIQKPSDAADFLRVRMAHLDREEFHAVWLDRKHAVLGVERLFIGTLDAAAVHPREVVRSALAHNAGAVILAHNHPSQVPEPSSADRAITEELKRALALIDVRLLDHFVVAATSVVSMAERGLL